MLLLLLLLFYAVYWNYIGFRFSLVLLQGVAIEKKWSIQMTKERGFDKYNNNLKT